MNFGIQLSYVNNNYGLAFGLLVCGAKNIYGVQIGVVNKANNAHGIQFGLINVMWTSWIPFMPFINFSLNNDK
ncbi:MAG TPA: hypothetical protein QF753_13865 [Victivallales bacterium]|nr:hypothetical protein [Victivallales bacterium]